MIGRDSQSTAVASTGHTLGTLNDRERRSSAALNANAVVEGAWKRHKELATGNRAIQLSDRGHTRRASIHDGQWPTEIRNGIRHGQRIGSGLPSEMRNRRIGVGRVHSYEFEAALGAELKNLNLPRQPAVGDTNNRNGRATRRLSLLNRGGKNSAQTALVGNRIRLKGDGRPVQGHADAVSDRLAYLGVGTPLLVGKKDAETIRKWITDDRPSADVASLATSTRVAGSATGQ